MKKAEKPNKLIDTPLYIKGMGYLITTIFALSMIFPILIVISTSFTSQDYIQMNGYQMFPVEFDLTGYRYLFKNINQIANAYGITIAMTAFGTVFGVVCSFFYAYVIARPQFPWRMAFTFYVFFTTLFSGGALSSYLINTQYYHLQDTFWILALPGAIAPMNIIIMRTYIQSSIPEGVIESARIDGAKELTTLFKIVMPMSIPVIATIGLFLAVAYWNEWYRAMLYITEKDNLAPVSLIIQRIERNIDYLNNNASAMGALAEEERKNIPADSFRMALVIIAIAPMLIAYPFFQKFFMGGLTVGSIKG